MIEYGKDSSNLKEQNYKQFKSQSLRKQIEM